MSAYAVGLAVLVAGVAVACVAFRGAVWCWWATVARLVAHIDRDTR